MLLGLGCDKLYRGHFRHRQMLYSYFKPTYRKFCFNHVLAAIFGIFYVVGGLFLLLFAALMNEIATFAQPAMPFCVRSDMPDRGSSSGAGVGAGTHKGRCAIAMQVLLAPICFPLLAIWSILYALNWVFYWFFRVVSSTFVSFKKPGHSKERDGWNSHQWFDYVLCLSGECGVKEY